MGRSKRKRKKNNGSRRQRDVYHISETKRLLSSPFHREVMDSPLIIDDRRRYHPDGDRRSFKRLDGREAEYVLRDKQSSKGRRRSSGTLATLSFKEPEKVMVCRRRKQRRETLFKRLLIGRGISGPRKRRITWMSKVRC